MLYGAQIWGIQTNGDQLPQSQIKPLVGVQNKCLRRIAGAYQRTPITALEREIAIPPLKIYLDTIAQQRAIKTREHPIEQSTTALLQKIWHSQQPQNRIGGQRRRQQVVQRPQISQDLLRSRALERVERIWQATRTPQQPQQSPHPTKTLEKGLQQDWKIHWERKAQERQEGYQPATWAPWIPPDISLYNGLTKAEATALFLLRTEVLGLRAWLAGIGVPGVIPRCDCNWPAETATHVIFHCPQYSREALQPYLPIQRLPACLAHQRTAQAIAKWFTRSGALAQFSTAKEIAIEPLTNYAPFQDLEDWD